MIRNAVIKSASEPHFDQRRHILPMRSRADGRYRSIGGHDTQYVTYKFSELPFADLERILQGRIPQSHSRTDHSSLPKAGSGGHQKSLRYLAMGGRTRDVLCTARKAHFDRCFEVCGKSRNGNGNVQSAAQSRSNNNWRRKAANPRSKFLRRKSNSGFSNFANLFSYGFLVPQCLRAETLYFNPIEIRIRFRHQS